MKDRVCLFLPDLRAGGAEKASAFLANEMASRGGAVDLVLMNANGAWINLVAQEVRIVDLKAARYAKSIFPFAKYLRANRPAAVYSQMYETVVFAAAAIKLAGYRPKLISTIRSTTSLRYVNTSLKRRAVALLGKAVHRLAVDDIVAVSAGVKEDFSKFTGINPDRIKVISNFIDPSLQPKALEPISHPWLAGNESCPVFLGVGSLKHEKGFDILIKAFAAVLQNHPAKLIILGEGHLRGALEALVADLGVGDHVDLLGFTANPYPYMARCSAFVLSSRVEGMPNVLVEALALNTKCIATDCPSGPREILPDRQMLVPVDDVPTLARAMAAALV
jgi:glycosyltransferase involved in cell wall biosynthesis